MTSVAQLLLVLGLILAFGYFAAAGARTFERDESDVKGMMLGGFSVFVTGAMAAVLLSYRQVLYPVNGTVAAILLLGSIALYEWARRTIRARRFHLAWSGEVPTTVCSHGPYAWVRHPVYLAYMLAFLAMAIAFPRLLTGAILLFNVALYVHAARDDERSLAASELKEDYAAYRERTGMFFARLRGTSRA